MSDLRERIKAAIQTDPGVTGMARINAIMREVDSEVELVVRAMQDDIDALTARCAKLEEALENMAKWIVREADERERKARPFPVVWDGACEECGGSMIINGFRCAVHMARAALAAAKEGK